VIKRKAAKRKGPKRNGLGRNGTFPSEKSGDRRSRKARGDRGRAKSASRSPESTRGSSVGKRVAVPARIRNNYPEGDGPTLRKVKGIRPWEQPGEPKVREKEEAEVANRPRRIVRTGAEKIQRTPIAP